MSRGRDQTAVPDGMIHIPAEFAEICQGALPDYSAEFPPPGLPGTRPVPTEDWLITDAAFAPQMAFRDWLIAHYRGRVIQARSEASAALAELLYLVLAEAVDTAGRRVADGAAVATDRSDPLATLGHLVQEDFCILQKQGDAHVLTAAILCFPASWTLSEKIGRPLAGLHAPVDSYSDDMAVRVQRMFDLLRPDTVLCRTNRLRYADPCLFQPRTETDPRVNTPGTPMPFVRVERQTIRKLPEAGAVAFGIHSFVVRRPPG